LATSQLDLGLINIEEFLLQCCHTTERYLRDELNWQINVLGGATSESDEDDEEIRAFDHVDGIRSEDDNVEIVVVDLNTLDDNVNDYIIPEDNVPVQIEYAEIVVAERETERRHIPYQYYNRNAPLRSRPTNTPTCVICTEESTHVLVPCGHRILCGSEECSEGIENRRPICTTSVTLVMRVYD